ncbi:MAG: hypothetical protein ACNYZG_02710 [Gammaproteobacteria bacterium]
MEQTILIPVDGSEPAEATSLYVRSISPKEKTRIILLQVTANVSVDS